MGAESIFSTAFATIKFLFDFNPWIGFSSFFGTGSLTLASYLYGLTIFFLFYIIPSGRRFDPIVPVFFILNNVASGLYEPLI